MKTIATIELNGSAAQLFNELVHKNKEGDSREEFTVKIFKRGLLSYIHEIKKEAAVCESEIEELFSRIFGKISDDTT